MTIGDVLSAWLRSWGLNTPWPGCPECSSEPLTPRQAALVSWTLYVARQLLEKYRVQATGAPTSLVRCPTCNTRRGGTLGSRHQYEDGPGEPFGAVDIPVRGAEISVLQRVGAAELDQLAEEIGWPYGIGLIVYAGRIHVDLRESSWRG